MTMRIGGGDIVVHHLQTTATMTDLDITLIAMLLKIVTAGGRTLLARLNPPLTQTKSTAAVFYRSRSEV
jgi:hypothetical protein